MCSIKRLVVGSLLVVAFGVSLAAVKASCGVRDGGGGGDAIAIEFVGIAHGWDRFLSDPTTELPVPVTKAAFHEVIAKTLVRSDKQASFDGEVDAYNQGDKIVVNRDRWPLISREKKFALVLHEYLGVLGFDRHYEMSIPLMKKYGTRVQSQVVFLSRNGKRPDAFELIGKCSQVENVFAPAHVSVDVITGENIPHGTKVRVSAPRCSQKTEVLCECDCPSGFFALAMELSNQVLLGSSNAQTYLLMYCGFGYNDL